MNFRGLNYIQKDCEKVYFTELKRKHFTTLNTEFKCSQTEEPIVAAAISQCLVNPTLELELCRLYVRLLCRNAKWPRCGSAACIHTNRTLSQKKLNLTLVSWFLRGSAFIEKCRFHETFTFFRSILSSSPSTSLSVFSYPVSNVCQKVSLPILKVLNNSP